MGSHDDERPSLEIGFGRAKRARGTQASSPEQPRRATKERPVQKRPVRERPVRERPVRERPVREKPVRDRRSPYGLVTSCVLTGLLVGVALVGAGAGALRGCAQVRGTASCGTAGLPILAVILAAGVLLGAVALRWLSQTSSALSISFLALAFVALVCCLFLLGALDGPAALVIVPVLSVLGYLGAHLLTSRYIEPEQQT